MNRSAAAPLNIGGELRVINSFTPSIERRYKLGNPAIFKLSHYRRRIPLLAGGNNILK